MTDPDDKTKVYPLQTTINCPHCGAEIAVVFHQERRDLGGGCIVYDVPDAHDPIYCTRCGKKIV